MPSPIRDDDVLVDVFVPGAAVAQGSMTPMNTAAGPRARHPVKVVEYRARIAQIIGPVPQMWLGPVIVVVEHRVVRPAGHYGSGRNASQVKPSAPAFPTRRGADLDKVCRIVLDALTDAGVWRDDSQCVSLGASRLWAGRGLLAGLRVLATRMPG